MAAEGGAAVSPVVVAAQLALLALACAPFVPDGWRDWLLLGSVTLFGAALGATLGRAWSEREGQR